MRQSEELNSVEEKPMWAMSESKAPQIKGDADFVKEIVNLVLKKLVKHPVNSKRLVGIDHKIATITSWIRKGPQHTHLIGIWGMGGIGKTTLAEEIFNKLQHEYEVAFELERLKDRALITTSEDNIVSMHDSLQEMAWEVVRQKSIEDPRSCSWLWDLDDINEALRKEKVNEVVRRIKIQLSTFEELKFMLCEIYKLSRLKFLEISMSYLKNPLTLAEGPQFSATELRYLSCDHFPLKSLPENFSAEKLVILKLKWGRMEKLWDGVKNLVNLKQVDLRGSKKLKWLPDLSKATNLEVLLLGDCHSLTKVDPSIFSLPKLEKLELEFCKSLSKLISDSPLCSLSYLNLGWCKKLREFSLISQNLKELKLQGTKVCKRQVKPFGMSLTHSNTA
ncbi:hypothetical protein VNO78_04858 [Psophocarpus tetragonolobus]|uniref:NB-ARC domain-containing protein n=1 Tax=Psophocarpus tetragonolobus TaxID=3891 RepID=A0AAN9XXR4_PSOTE